MNTDGFDRFPTAEIPDLFTFFDGGAVKDEADWRRRRKEISDWFSAEVYGRFPEGAERGFAFRTAEEHTAGDAVLRTVEMRKGGFSSRFRLYLPRGAARPPVLVYAMLKFYDGVFDLDRPDVYASEPSVTSLPLGELLRAGFAVAVFRVGEAAADEPNGKSTGLPSLLVGEPTDSSAGAVAAWAFYASRVVDYLVGSGETDAGRIGVAGHSRGGKAALLAAASDERFRFAVVSNSGCTGAALERGKTGERIADITAKFPHWFAKNYDKYAGREGEMATDFHALCALVAPRLLYVTSSTEDDWACPRNEFASCRLASPVWEKIYGVPGLVAPDVPTADETYGAGNVAYHIKRGKHSFDLSDWHRIVPVLLSHLGREDR